MKGLRIIGGQLLLALSGVFGLGEAEAQYFGRNKARYETFDFKVLQTPNFEIYHYLSDSTAKHLADLSERWYALHQGTFRDTIKYRNPIIFYSDHADFQQTGAISGLINIGTGGVTEAFKNRVVMPLRNTWAQTDHVLGHELVHAFQYNLVKADDSLSLNNLRNLPLWMVEGLAEYLSIGRVDAHTAMWMRDAVMQDDIPTIKDLNTKSRYFPYRYGQAFWAFIGGVYGDSTVMELYENTARFGLEAAVDSTLNINTKTLSGLWKASLETHYQPMQPDSIDSLVGRPIHSTKWEGTMNVSPSISPNGNYILFLSERDLFTIDLYLADFHTGQILKKITGIARNEHIDAIDFIESAGTWSPDSRSFAHVVYSKGRSKLIVVNVLDNKVIREIDIPGVSSISNPAWSPKGDEVVFSGMIDGQSDLFIYNLNNGLHKKLTNDPYSDIQPSWSPEGDKIVYVTDRLNYQRGWTGSLRFNLAIVDVTDRSIEDIEVFPGADNLNPVFVDDESILFLSNNDGFRNMYLYRISEGEVFQLTDYFTGISGITTYSPAIDYNALGGEVAYTYYAASGYRIYKAKLSDFEFKTVPPDRLDLTAATLPPFTPVKGSWVQDYLSTINRMKQVEPDSLREIPYKAKFKLDYIGNTTIGLSTSSLGTGMVGGVNTIWSDVLGNNQLFAGLALNGEIYDFGGQVAYFNQKSRVSWGAAISHVPFRAGRVGIGIDTLRITADSVIQVDNIAQDVMRTFEDQVSLFAYFPLSQTRRFEWGATAAAYNFRLDRFNNYYYKGFRVGQTREKLPAPDGYGLWSSYVAFVGDNSHFGMASPMKGGRFRYEVSRQGGVFDFYTLLADYRKYIYVKPFSFGFRAYHYARYGADIADGRISPLFLGFPTLIRGYDDVNFSARQGQAEKQLSINDLYGSKMAVANFEIRFPFSGPGRLALIDSKYFLTELNLFVDAGTVWDPQVFETREGTTFVPGEIGKIITSTGVSMRINILGQLIVEPYYTIPWQRRDVQGAVWGINFTPGW